MRIDRSRIKKSTSEVPAECQALIDRLRSCSQKELLEELKKIETWTFGKCELYHWIDILDLCDAILEKAAARVSPKSWQLACDLPGNEEIKELLQWVLYFTTLLIEHSFSRHLYNSVEHLLTLLSSCDLQVVMSVLNLLYMFSKRSNFIARLAPEMRNILLRCLTYLAESWGGKENGFGLADCSNECYCPLSATTVHFEFYADEAAQGTSQISCIHLENVDELDKTPAEIMDGLVEAFKVPKDGQMLLYTHIRLAYSFSDYERRLKCVQARLQALSVLLYSNTFSDSHLLLYPGILDELVELLELNDPALVDIRSAALRTLTSIIHLDRSPHLPKKPGSRLNNIIDVTGAGMYHGFLPQLVRSCICSLTSDSTDTQEQFPLALATALFSFLYHLASYEAGGEALVSCGMMECLLRVINWPGTELEHITFVTRAVRVIDLITNIDMQVFQNHGGLASFINRLEMEIAICRREQPFEIIVDAESTSRDNQVESDTVLDEEMMSIEVDSDSSSPSCSKETASDHCGDSVKSNKTCLPQRAALLKSMLNFLKKALQDPAFSDSIRHVMDGSLPSSLKHIISNAEYYGPSLFLLATDVVAVYVFQEPSLLSSLQDNGLTDVVLHALLVKNVPATREVLGSLPNVFSALCLNARGLESFVKFCPFDRLFKVLLSPTYLSAMRRRRSSEPIGDTASTLGNAMDELMRHQPSLKVDAISAIIRLLDELCRLGKNPKYVCWRPQKGSNNGESPHQTPRSGNEAGSSDEEEDDEEEASTSSHPQREDTSVDQTSAVCHEKTPVALVDYILNVMKFIDAILSNNSTDDHCREFVNQNGLAPLLSILGLPNLPVDYPITPAAQSVASVCKSILNLAHEARVLGVGLSQLSIVLSQLKPLQKSHSRRKGSVLLNELASAACIDTAFSTPLATPMLHAMAAAHGYVVMFVHVCRTGQLDIRTISMTQWGSETGLSVLEGLAELYTALVWESTILLALCSEDVSCDFNKEDIEKLLSPDIKSVDIDISSEMSSGGMTAAMEQLNTNLSSEPMEVDTSPGSSPSSAKNKSGVTSAIQLKYIKPLLGASSRLGRALAELFGLLVKLCVGFPVRNRRGNHLTSTPISPTPSAQAVASELAALLARGLKFDKLPLSPVPKFRLTYLICSVGFTSPMLFDEKKYPYHLMLQKFVLLKGQKAFFESFMWALSGGGKFDADDGLEHPDLPEGTGEFLDAWLLLLEKMVNPKAILDSTHVLPTRSTSVGVIKMFDPVRYLQQVHKLAFNAIGYLWGRKPLKTYGERMTDTLLIICRHILRGEKIIEERKLKDLDVVVANPSAEGRRGQGQREHRPEVNMNEMAQLMDMGFSREHCYEALILTSTIEHATDYLLNNFFPQHSQAARFISPIDEEEEEFEPLTKDDLDRFSEGALRICLKLLEALPGTVYRVCDLLTTIMRRNGEKFTYDLLSGLARVLIENLTFMTLILDELKLTDEDVVAALTTSVEAQRVAAIIHLYMLLFEEIRIPCAKVVHSSGMLPLLIQLLIQGTAFLEMNPTISTPKWLAPLLLLIDLLEKVSIITNRKANMHKVTTHIWRWFDLTTGKWALYLPLNNKLINDSYWKGDNMLRIVSGRRHYTIMFNQMIQTNEDSGKQRPIMMSLVENREGATSLSETREDDDSPSSSPILVTRAEASRATLQSSNGDSMEYEPATDFYHRRTGLQGIPGVGTTNATHIVRTCVRLMKIPVDGDTLHAVLQVCVRFTRDYDNAEMAAEMGVVKILLNLTSTTVFSGFLGLATILIRHILEEPGTLYSAMEKVIRAKTLANIPSSYKELHYILRECSAAICRDPETFKTAAKDILRIDVSLLNKRSDEEDTRLLMKSVTNPTGGIGTVTQNLLRLTISKSVIYDLLDALIEPDEEDINIHEPPETESPMFMEMQSPLINSAAPRRIGDINPVNPINPDDVTTEQLNRVTSQPFDPSALPVYMALTQPPNTLPTPASSSSSSKSGTSERKLKMLGKAAVLKILGDAVRSYSNVAKMITEFRYKANKSPLIKEDCSPVAFVLDHLLSLRERALIDLDVASMARMLIAALASCNHSPDAQAALVSEVKAALTRTLAWPESKKKHYHIQDIVGIVTIMIESCPHVPLCNSPLNSAVKLHQYSANNMVRLMMRKGIATDLARISHSLDLSSPKLSATMNAVLKPLETLSRIMSQPSGVQPGKLKTKPRTPAPSSDEPSMQTGTSTSEATHAQGEESVEDADNTDHDVSGTAEIVSEAINQQEDVMDADEISDGFVLTRDTEPVADSESNTRNRYNLFEGAGDLSFQSMNNDETIQSSTEDSDSNSSDERIDVDAPTDIDEQVEDMIEGLIQGLENTLSIVDNRDLGIHDSLHRRLRHTEDEDPRIEFIRSTLRTFVVMCRISRDIAPLIISDLDELLHVLQFRRLMSTTTCTAVEETSQQAESNYRENEGDETGGAYDEEGLELSESDEGLFHIPGLDPDSDDFLMIEYSDPEAPPQLGPWTANATFPLSFSIFEDPTTIHADSTGGLNRIPSQHPLLMTRQNLDSSSGLSSSRAQRLNRTRRYQYVQMNRTSAAPVFLQRLMGQTDQTFSSNGNTNNPDVISTFGSNTRVIVMDNGLGILTNTEEEQINFVDQAGYLLGPSLAATLNNVPTSMHWWNEEGRLLDGESQADCAVVMGHELIPIFEKFRNEECMERKEKRRKHDDAECNKKTDAVEGEKKAFSNDGLLDMFEPQLRLPTRPTTRRIAMLAAAQEVAQATENLAGSIVESVLHPRAIPPPPPALPQENNEPSSPDYDIPLPNSSDPDLIVRLVREPVSNSIPEALELIPVAPPPNTSGEISDPLGLIPGSVPFPAPTDPDDGYYRVNPPEGYRSAPVDMSSAPHSSSFFINHQCNLHSTVSETSDPLEIETTNWVRSAETNEGTTETNIVQPPQETPAPAYSSTETSQNFDISDQSTIVLDPQSIAEAEINLTSSHETISASDTSQNTSEHSSPPSHRPPSGSALNPIELGSSPLTDSQDEEVPEGVDPSFLAALPEDMRAEVVAEQFRLQRLRQQASEVSAAAAVNDTAGAMAGPSGTNLASVLEVNPDFLAALPPAIQEEVLAQQRLEQQRQAASTSNPNEPVDAAAFFQDLPHSLRQAILTDMEESQISVLPPELAAEAQNLRREWEARNRQLMQERFLNHVSNSTSALSSILRTSTGRGTRRAPGTRYAIRSLPTASGPRDWAREFGPRHHRLVHNITSVTGQAGSSATPASLLRSRGRQVLDYESICCLLVLLFIEDSRLNTVRLHRVFRNLCCHAPTRDWVVKALLSIMEKSNITQTVSRVKETLRPRGGKRMTTRSQVQPDSISFLGNQAQRPPQAAWLNISMDAALGCRATVFTVHRSGRRSEKSITINPQAAPFVYRHALDILISLAKIFPICFTPTKGPAVTTGTLPKLPVRSRHELSNFWEILIYLDSLSRSKKGKVAARTVTQASNNEAESTLEASPFGLLLTMLDAPVICRSPALMDKLLRLLSVISVSLQLNKQPNVYKLETTSGIFKPLSLAVNVLTSSNCSEEGLEDATALLLNMSVNLPNTRDMILWLLLECAHKMASVVCGHIERLLRELRELNSQQNQNDEMEASTSESKGTPLKGVLSNRFTKDIVVVTAPKKVKAGLDLQLSSMAPLICKNSSQSFFLRILKVIVQIRDSMKSGDKKDKKEDTQVQEGNERGEIPTPMDTSSPVPPRHGRPTCSSPDVFASNDDDDDDEEEEEDDESDGNLQQAEQPQQHQQLPQPPSQSQAQQEIQPLSEQLNLGELWDTLSNCLTELAHTQDSHAVLVLQPAVEAFFLVHAAGIEKPSTENNYTIQHSTQAGPSTSNDPGPSVSEEFGAPAPPPVSPLPNEPAPDSVATALAHMSYSPVGLDHSWAQNMPPHQQKFLKFAETHRTVLNQILRQCTTPLLEGPFAVLVNHTRVLDFDVKRRYFRSELERADEGHRREELAVHVRRTHVFEDSFRELHRRAPNDWKNRFYIVFEGEEGQDAGGLLREWYMIISREIFNPNYALFTISPGDRVTYTINPSSHCNSNHLSYFKFVGRVIAKAIYDNKLLECYFTRSFYKHILGIRVKYTDMESEDYSFYQGLAFLMDNDVKSLGSELTFSTEVQEFGVTEIRDLIPSGRHMLVTEKNKMDYIRLVCQLKMTGAIRQQLNAFLEGFYDIIPKRLISIFNEQELELLISGLPNVDIDDLKTNTEYYKYQPNSLQIQWFWRALREFDQAERAKFLQFVTGTSKVPLQGFAALEGMNGVQKFQIHRDERSTDRLPSAHTCFNQLDLPVYETYTKLRTYLLKAIHECSEGFGFA